MKFRTVIVISLFLSSIIGIGMIGIYTPVFDNLQYSGTIHSVDSTGDGYPDRIADDSEILEKQSYNVVIEVTHYDGSEELSKQEIERVKALFELQEMKYADSINMVFVDSGEFSNEEYPDTDVSELYIDRYTETVSEYSQFENSGTYHIVITENVRFSDKDQAVSGVASGSVALVESNPYKLDENNNNNNNQLPLREHIISHEIGHLIGISGDYEKVDKHSDWDEYPSVMNYTLPCSIDEALSNCDEHILTFTDTDNAIMELYLSNREYTVANFELTQDDVLDADAED